MTTGPPRAHEAPLWLALSAANSLLDDGGDLFIVVVVVVGRCRLAWDSARLTRAAARQSIVP